MNIKIKPSEHKSIVSLYLQGKSCYELAKKYSVYRHTISDILKKNGVTPVAKMPRKFNFNENFFDSIDSEEKAYFLGWMYSDGFNINDQAMCGISIQENDRYILEEFASALNFTGNIKTVPRKLVNPKHQNLSRLELNSRKMSDTLSKIGCPQRKSLILKFPSEKIVPPELLRHFIRGYLDGDGSLLLYKDKSGIRNKFEVSFTSSSLFCESLQIFIKKQFGFNTRLKLCPNKQTKSLILNGNRQCIIFLSWLYNGCKLKLIRKYNKFLEYIRIWLKRQHPHTNGGSKVIDEEIHNNILNFIDI